MASYAGLSGIFASASTVEVDREFSACFFQMHFNLSRSE